MRVFLKFIAQVPHPKIANATVPSDHYVDASQISEVQTVHEKGTGVTAVLFALSEGGTLLGRAVFNGYTALGVLTAVEEAALRLDHYVETSAWPKNIGENELGNVVVVTSNEQAGVH